MRKKLNGKEATLSVKHAPTDKKGRPLCWDACTWVGCKRKAG